MRFTAALIIFLALVIFEADSAGLYHSYIVKTKSENKPAINSAAVDKIFQGNSFPVKEKNRNKVLSDAQLEKLKNLKNYYVVETDNNPGILNKLENDTNIIEIFPNHLFSIENNPNDPKFGEQWSLKSINVNNAWDIATGNDILIGVIDTGIDYDHEDLKNQLWINPDEDINGNGTFEPWSSEEERDGVTGDFNGIDEDGNGFVDDVIGFDFVDQLITNVGDAANPDPDPADEQGHGTKVSGIIAAEHNNNTGITGIAYDSKIVSLRAFDFNGTGESDDIARAIVYAALNGVQVLNFSFGEPYDSPLIRDAVRFAYSMGCTMLASTGNNGWDRTHYPSDYREIIAVGGSNTRDEKYSFSNYGSRISLVAPGTRVYTTDPNNSYGTASGTSMSTPHACAVAAMLLEVNPNLTSDDIHGILQVSARDINQPGWDIFTGSGILDAFNALKTIGKTNIYIDFPENEGVFIIERDQNVDIKGSVLTPLFESYQLFYAAGLNQKSDTATLPEREYNWNTITDEISAQKSDEILGSIKLSGLKDTTYTIRLLVKMRNGKTLEKRTFVNVISENNTIKITGFGVIYPFFNNKRHVYISFKTDRKANAEIKFRLEGSQEDYIKLKEVQTMSEYHSFLIGYEASAGVSMEAVATVYRENGTRTERKFKFTRPKSAMPEDNFIQKDYSIPASYFDNEVIDFFGNGNPSFAVNDLSAGTWGDTKIYEYKNGQMNEKFSHEETWLPQGLGDSNGDQINEVLAFEAGNTVLFQSKSKTGNPFTRTIFADTLNAVGFWAADLFDVNRDGLEDIVAYNDTSVFVYTYENGKYVLFGKAVDDDNKFIGTAPGVAVGDFDNDDDVEICFGNDHNGNILIYETPKGNFVREFIDEDGKSEGSINIITCDIEGDGIPEILIGQHGTDFLFPNNHGGDQIWQFRILKYKNGKYQYVWKDYIFGVRIGLSYKNGLAAGDLDNNPGDEIIIGTFPNLYIFKWNNNSQNMEPFWWYPNTITNSSIVYDFDSNGVNEFGFTGIFPGETGYEYRTAFYEYNIDFQGPDLPSGLDGWALGETTAKLFWNPAANAEEYIVYKVIRNENGTFVQGFDSTSNSEIILHNLENNTEYEFVVRSKNESLQTIYSSFSDIVLVYTHRPIDFATVTQQDCNKLLVTFSGLVGTEPMKPSKFVLKINSNEDIEPVTVQIASDSSVILTFNKDLKTGTASLFIDSFADRYGTPSKIIGRTFETNCEQPDREMYLKKLTIVSFSELELQYSHPVNINQAKDIGNYTIHPHGKINQIDQTNSDESKVKIFLDRSFGIGALGKNYTLTVTNVESKDGIPITKGAGNTLGFVFSKENSGSAFVYPNPVKISDGNQIYFANLPQRSDVIIYTLQGEVLRRIEERDGNGGVEWDGLDRHGKELNPGIYLFKVEKINDDGSTELTEFRKFVIQN